MADDKPWNGWLLGTSRRPTYHLFPSTGHRSLCGKHWREWEDRLLTDAELRELDRVHNLARRRCGVCQRIHAGIAGWSHR